MIRDPRPRDREGHGPDAAPLLRAEGDDQVPRGAPRRPAQVPRPAPAALRRVRHAQVRDVLPVRPGLPDRVHRHGRDRHEGPLPRPLGRARDVRRAARRVARCDGPAGRSRTRPTPTSTRSTSGPLEAILEDFDHDPKQMLQILEATQAAYGHLPVAALKLISQRTGAWYAMIYGTASYYRHLRFEPPGARSSRPRSTPTGPPRRRYLAGLEAALAGGRRGERRPGPGARRPAAGRSLTVATILRTPAALAGDPARPAARASATRSDLDARPRGAARSRASAARVHELGPAGTIATIAASGLRGRGGGGFPTAEKWRAAAATDAPRRYVVAQRLRRRPVVARPTGRSWSANPYAVLEGVAHRGVRDRRRPRRSSPSAPRRPRRSGRSRAAIAPPMDAGFAGHDVLGSGRAIEITVRPVQGAYMLGEETVLLKALEGKRGQPEQRPPHPAERGLFGRPTVVQNVQTLAAVPWILANGAEAFAAIGSKASPGTILVPVRGAGRRRRRRGPARDAAPRHRRAWPARSGRRSRPCSSAGPSGGHPAGRRCSTRRTSSKHSATVGAHVGSGSIVAADERACIVDLARLLTRFCADEACGKTIPCRIGTAPDQRDRRPDRDRRPAPDRPPAPGRPVGRHRRVRAVRPRAPGDPSVRERNAILPVRARRAHPPQLLPGRRLPTDRGRGGRSAH